MTLGEFKEKLYKCEIRVDWDSGHSYHYHDGVDYDDCYDPNSAADLVQTYYQEYGPELYCVPEIVRTILNKDVLTDDCSKWRCSSDSELREHLIGFIELADKMGRGKWYETDKLRSFVKMWESIDTLGI